MSGSSFGTLFRVTTFGESHGAAMGCIVDGCPAGVPVSVDDIQPELDRRRPGQSRLTTPRDEADRVEFLSGVFEGHTLGTSIGMLVRNKDADSSKYEAMRGLYRPSHADYTTEVKYGRRDWRGGGRASARETVARVAAGALARKLLSECCGVEVVAFVESVADIAGVADLDRVTRADVDGFDVRCPDADAAAKMTKAIKQAQKARDTLGGVVTCVARGVPPGLGVPVFDKLEADLAKAMLSLPAAKGFESGSGFAGTRMMGSAHNDPFAVEEGRVITTTNHSGGIQGGISNGMPVVVRVAFKPVATHFQTQETVTSQPHASTEFQAKGRHDPCVLPRAVPIVEAMMCLVLADHWLRQRAISSAVPGMG